MRGDGDARGVVASKVETGDIIGASPSLIKDDGALRMKIGKESLELATR